MLIVAVLLSGCYGLPTTPPAPAGCGFPEGTHFAFIGTASRADLGFPQDDSLVAKWWVSSERLPWTGHWKANTPPPPLSRQACGFFPGGSIGIQLLPLDWHPPFDASSS